VIKWVVEKSTPSGVYEIRAQWDSEAGVWVAESEDVPGLVAEADSPNVLVQKLRTLIPELLELNGATSGRTASFHVLYQHEDSGILTF
jgi:predicted RNase H-like HicB family nuclease